MPQQLPSKERSLFQQVVKNYESKQYKKGIKAADQILRKVPDHGDTQAMKALILNAQNQTEEAFKLAKDALKNDMKSHICWHVYGLLYRSAKNFEESMKAYRMALRWEPDSQQIQRDLAMLQVQMRDFEGYAGSRHAMLQARPGWRANWTALAIAQHMSGNLGDAEKTLRTYEETLKTPPPKTDTEHQEAVLYKNRIISEMGHIERALDHLNAVSKGISDQQTVLELKATYLLQLERNSEAEKVYRQLLGRNAEYRTYYEGLEKALDLKPGQTAARKAIYTEYAERNKRGDAALRIQLDFLSGSDFREVADVYLRRKLRKGVPSTFANLKALYSDAEKQSIILDLVEGYKVETSAEKVFEDGVNFFLAQHYDYYLTRNLAKATEAIEKLLERDPKSVDYLMTKARIYKHDGNLDSAAQIMERARASDEKDRYINTKAAKYQLRNDQNGDALKNMSKFTKPDAVGGALSDLTDMQSVWFMTEDGESRSRQGQLGLALKRFHSVYNIYDIWQEDQYDFHGFSLRKGQIRAYIDMLKWEDQLRNHPFFVRAALGAVKVYLRLHDDPSLSSNGLANGDNADPSGRKKAAKRARRDAEKQAQIEHERRDARKTAGTGADGDLKKVDLDPEGVKLAATEQPLEDAMKFVTPLIDFKIDKIEVLQAVFEISIRRAKWLPAMRCLLLAKRSSPEDAFVHTGAIRFRVALAAARDTLPSSVLDTIEELAPGILPPQADDLSRLNDEFLAKRTGFRDQIAGLEARQHLNSFDAESSIQRLTKLLASASTSLEDAVQGLEAAKRWKTTIVAYGEAARRHWPNAKAFKAC